MRYVRGILLRTGNLNLSIRRQRQMCIRDSFLVDETYEPGFATVTLPYEFLPLPEKGEKGYGMSRSGEKICEAEVVSVRTSKAFDHTNLLTIKVPADMAMKARFYRKAEA